MQRGKVEKEIIDSNFRVCQSIVELSLKIRMCSLNAAGRWVFMEKKKKKRHLKNMGCDLKNT